MRVGWMMDCFFFIYSREKGGDFFFDYLTSRLLALCCIIWPHALSFSTGGERAFFSFFFLNHSRGRAPSSFKIVPYKAVHKVLSLSFSLFHFETKKRLSLLRRTSQENARVYAPTQGTHTSKQKWHSLREAFLRSGSARRTTSARKAPRRVAKTDR